MTGLILLTAPDCHLCEHGKDVLAEVGLDWRAVPADSEEGRRLAAIAPPLRPALFDESGRRLIAYGRLSARRLRKQRDRGELAAPSASRPTTPLHGTGVPSSQLLHRRSRRS